MKFPYLYRKKNKYPIVPIILKFEDRELKTEALIDSGASISVFNKSISDYFGISLKSGDEIYLQGIGKKILAYKHKVNLKINDKEFLCNIAFTSKLNVSINILGRDNFFEQFIISFNEKQKEVILLPIKHKKLL